PCLQGRGFSTYSIFSFSPMWIRHVVLRRPSEVTRRHEGLPTSARALALNNNRNVPDHRQKLSASSRVP
ncbi:hypothetical protein HAX54_003280, partial [Datura stramonium]|nr:hypothetical protein [Datura stramonium]